MQTGYDSPAQAVDQSIKDVLAVLLNKIVDVAKDATTRARPPSVVYCSIVKTRTDHMMDAVIRSLKGIVYGRQHAGSVGVEDSLNNAVRDTQREDVSEGDFAQDSR